MRGTSLSPTGLALRSLTHHWRLSLVLALATAVAVAVLTGPLLVGSSMRASLRALALDQLGQVTDALVSEHYFRKKLADAVTGGAPVIAVRGAAAHAEGGARTGRVQVFGVDGRFWRMEGGSGESEPWKEIGPDDAVLNAALARELMAHEGDEVLLRVERPSAAARETLLGARDETVLTLRLRVARIVENQGLGHFALAPSQREPLNIYVPLATLQRRLDRAGRINAILSAAPMGDPQAAMRAAFTLEDLGVHLRLNAQPRYLSLESERIFLPPPLVEQALSVAREHGLKAAPTLTYLANEIRIGEQTIPYSTVAGIDEATWREWVNEKITITSTSTKTTPIILNDWAAKELGARVGDSVAMTYFVPGTGGELAEQTTTITLAAIAPMTPPWLDPGLTPEYPGIADADKLSNWDPPFPLDMGRIRPADEDYWDRWRAAPKAFLPLAMARGLWANRYGELTAIRLTGNDLEAFGDSLRERLDPTALGLAFEPVREAALRASRGSSDFAGLFIGFSLFLLASAAMLISALFRLGIEGRVRQYGLLAAVGFEPRRLRRLMLIEGGLIAAAGALVGAVLAVPYAGLLVHGLRTWWVGAVGTPFISLAVEPAALAGGLAGGWLVALLAILRAARRMARLAPRAMLTGHVGEVTLTGGRRRCSLIVGLACLALGAAAALGAPKLDAARQAMLFFTAGALLLVAALAFFATWLRRAPGRKKTAWPGARLTITGLGLGAARRNPGRSLLVAGLVASATFIIVAVGANRHAPGVPSHPLDPNLVAESALPLYAGYPSGGGGHDPRFDAIRLREGDDASCLNLYQAAEPRVFGVDQNFVERGAFSFTSSLAKTEQQRQNPWRLLEETQPDGAVPAIGDQNTVTWLLHKSLGDEITVGGRRLRIVGLIKGSLFQSGLVISEEHFKRLFPENGGWRFFLITYHPADPSDPAAVAQLAAKFETDYENYGMDVESAEALLGGLAAVENTYLAAFQTLGGLGLLLGTLGLALTLARNLIERRAELALLRAVGYRYGTLVWLATAENGLLLVAGLAAGAACALVAAAPALGAREAAPPWGSLALMLGSILAFGLAAGMTGAALLLRAPALRALKEE